jgi:hypothetical protein
VERDDRGHLVRRRVNMCAHVNEMVDEVRITIPGRQLEGRQAMLRRGGGRGGRRRGVAEQACYK